MKILVVSLLYAPDTGPTAHSMTPLVEHLVRLGHEVTVVAAMPHYGANRIYPGHGGALWRIERRGRLRIVRLALYVPRNPKATVRKALSWLSFNAFATPVALSTGRPDVIFTLSPPYTLGLTAAALGRMWRVPFVYNVQDIYPDVAVQQGYVRTPAVVRLLSAVERSIYRQASAVSVLGEGARRNLLAKGVGDDKLWVIPNLVDTDWLVPGDRDNAFARRFGFEDRFVVMYAGNVGASLGVETILESMRMLRDDPRILFAFAARGTALPGLQAACADEAMRNVTFLPFQTRETIPEMYASSDAQLVIQRKGFSEVSVPMKVYAIMASGRPVLAAVDEDSDTAELIHHADAGQNAGAEDPPALVASIVGLADDTARARRLGANGRRYVETHVRPEQVARRYEQCFTFAVEGFRGYGRHA